MTQLGPAADGDFQAPEPDVLGIGDLQHNAVVLTGGQGDPLARQGTVDDRLVSRAGGLGGLAKGAPVSAASQPNGIAGSHKVLVDQSCGEVQRADTASVSLSRTLRRDIPILGLSRLGGRESQDQQNADPEQVTLAAFHDYLTLWANPA